MNISHKSCHERNSEYWMYYTTQFRCNTSLECHTFPEHQSPSPVLSGFRVTRSVVLCACFVERCLPFCTFYFVVLSVLLWYRNSDYPFDIFKLFFLKQQQFEDTKLVIRSRNVTLKNGGEHMCSGRMTSSCSISGTTRVIGLWRLTLLSTVLQLYRGGSDTTNVVLIKSYMFYTNKSIIQTFSCAQLAL